MVSWVLISPSCCSFIRPRPVSTMLFLGFEILHLAVSFGSLLAQFLKSGPATIDLRAVPIETWHRAGQSVIFSQSIGNERRLFGGAVAVRDFQNIRQPKALRLQILHDRCRQARRLSSC